MHNNQDAVSTGDGQSVSTTLLQLVWDNDPIGWERLVKLFSPLVYQWCRSKGLKPSTASDVSQDVFVAVAKGISKFRRDKEGDSFRGWLWTITINKIRDNARRAQRHPDPIGGSEFQMSIGTIEFEDERSETEQHSDTNTLLHSALKLIENEFEPQSIEVFVKSVIEEKTANHIGEELGISVAAVYKAKSRVMHRLREELGELIN